MPTYDELVNELLRDYEGFTGDGRGGVGALPVGDRSTAKKPIEKSHLRQLFLFPNNQTQDAVDAALRAEAAAAAALSSANLPFASRQAFSDATVPVAREIAQFVEGGEVHTVIRATGGPIVQGNGVAWKPSGAPCPEMFTSAWAVDAGPGLRAARDYLAANGGGTIRLTRRTYPITSTETRSYFIIGSSSSAVQDVSVALALPAGVTLAGDSRGGSVIQRIGGGISAIVALENYGNAAVRDVAVVGPGGDGNTMHGIATYITHSGDHVIDGMTIERVQVRNVGSYGIGQQYCGQRRCIVRDIEVENTGSDGIDWKIRGPLGQQTVTDTVSFENIRIKTFGVRLPGSSSTGFGLRGQARVRGISIYDIGPGQVGLQVAPGVNVPERGDMRKTAFYTEVDGVYCEGRDPRAADPAIGVQVYATDRCIVSNVVAKHCIIGDNVAGTSPPAALHGPVWKNCLVIPPHNAQWAAVINLSRTSMEIEVQSDYDWFDVRAGTATAGQTAFTLPRGAPTAGYAVVRNGSTITTGFTVSGSTITLSAGLGISETLCVVYPAQRAVRVQADYAAIRGSCDDFTGLGVNYAVGSNVTTGNSLGFAWRGNRGVDILNDATIAGIVATGPEANKDLRVTGKGTGLAVVSRPGMINVPTSASGLPAGTVWNDAGTLKIV